MVSNLDSMRDCISYEEFRNNWVENNSEWFNEDKKLQHWNYKDPIQKQSNYLVRI